MVGFFTVVFLSVLLTVAVYLWLGSIWACLAVISFTAALWVWIYACMNALVKTLQVEARQMEQVLELRLIALNDILVSRLDEILKAVKD